LMSASTNAGPEIAQRLRKIREQILQRLQRKVPQVPDFSPPSLEPLKNAQTSASRLAVAIGTVSPRPPGLANALIQTIQRSLARMLDWQVRPQREFNQAVAQSLAETAAVLEATQKSLESLAQSLEEFRRLAHDLFQEHDSLREHLEEQMKLQREDVEEQIKRQRWSYEGTLLRQGTALQEKIMELVQNELRLLRQRVAAQARAGSVHLAAAPAVAPGEAKATPVPPLDYYQLEHHFRGTEEEIRVRQSFYLPYFRGRKNVLDLACGRGEFLELMREAGIAARGVDADADMVGRCREKGLDVAQADIFDYLKTIPDGSLDGVFCAQFVEHLAPEVYITLLAQCAQKLAPSGILAVETPNPECLAIFSQTFYLDPTHVRPIPPAQLRFLFAEAGLTRLTTHFLSPAGAGLPLIPPLAANAMEADKLKVWNDAVAKFNETFFGGMDYAVIGCRLVSAARPGAEVPLA